MTKKVRTISHFFSKNFQRENVLMLQRLNLLSFLKLMLLIIILLLLLPYFNIILLMLKPNSDYLNFIIKNGVLTRYIMNTIELILKVGILAAVIAFIGAYFMAFYSFKFKKIINLLFILPLSIPVYVGAYVYSDIYLSYPLLKWLLKNDFTMNSTVFIYVIFLYPYIYLTSYAYLKNYMQEYIEAAQVLKLSTIKIFWRVILPLSRPIIFSSVLFVIYESLSDFAVSEYYGTATLSKAFNDAWRVTAEPVTSAKLAVFLMIIIALIISFEKFLRRKARVDSSLSLSPKLIKAKPSLLLLIYSFYALIIGLAFILPFQKIISGAINNYSYFFKRDTLQVALQTFGLSVAVIVLISLIAMFLTAMLKYIGVKKRKKISLIATLGYMIPSMILSLGVYSLCFNLDLVLNDSLKRFGLTTFIFTNSSLALIIGLSLKFLAIAYNNYEQCYHKISPSIFEAALSLGKNPIQTFFKVDLHFLRQTSKYIFILVALDVFKELTLAFTLSPFNFRTLSMEIYHYMANEMQQVAYVPAFIIVTICVAGIIVLERGLIHDNNQKFEL